jgi:large subunit ribosomal protein L15
MGLWLIHGIGKRIVDLQTSMALVSRPRNPTTAHGPDDYGRVPFEHPALEGLTNLSERAKSEILQKSRLAHLGQDYGVDEVMRWKPKKVRFANQVMTY